MYVHNCLDPHLLVESRPYNQRRHDLLLQLLACAGGSWFNKPVSPAVGTIPNFRQYLQQSAMLEEGETLVFPDQVNLPKLPLVPKTARMDARSLNRAFRWIFDYRTLLVFRMHPAATEGDGEAESEGTMESTSPSPGDLAQLGYPASCTTLEWKQTRSLVDPDEDTELRTYASTMDKEKSVSTPPQPIPTDVHVPTKDEENAKLAFLSAWAASPSTGSKTVGYLNAPSTPGDPARKGDASEARSSPHRARGNEASAASSDVSAASSSKPPNHKGSRAANRVAALGIGDAPAPIFKESDLPLLLKALQEWNEKHTTWLSSDAHPDDYTFGKFREGLRLLETSIRSCEQGVEKITKQSLQEPKQTSVARSELERQLGGVFNELPKAPSTAAVELPHIYEDIYQESTKLAKALGAWRHPAIVSGTFITTGMYNPQGVKQPLLAALNVSLAL